MTKLSPDFCFTIKKDTNPEKAYRMGFFLFPVMKNITEKSNGVELLNIIVEYYPEIEVLKY